MTYVHAIPDLKILAFPLLCRASHDLASFWFIVVCVLVIEKLIQHITLSALLIGLHQIQTR
jgi:hypothetical protein